MENDSMFSTKVKFKQQLVQKVFSNFSSYCQEPLGSSSKVQIPQPPQDSYSVGLG